MADDPRINWELANPYGISINDQEDAWWSGHVTDVLEMDEGIAGLLVATETGGVWTISTGGTTMPLSNSWDQPDIKCLAAGPDGPRHFYAGCVGGVIYETDASDPIPLLSWKPIEDPLPTGKGGVRAGSGIRPPPKAGNVNRIAVLRRHRLIVAACDGGLYWSEIPKTPQKRGCLGKLLPPPPPRAPYLWQRADEEDEGQTGYFSVAVGSLTGRTEGPGEEDLKNVSIVAGGNNGGVFIGRWDSGNLSLRRARLLDEKNVDLTVLWWWTEATGATSVAVCQSRPNHLYAACSFSDGRLKMVAHSKDGGRQWWKTGFDIASVPDSKDIRIEAGDGETLGTNIGVAPSSYRVVAFGWQGGVFLSMDEGKTWKAISGGSHLHPDVHVVLFTPTVDDKHYLYIGSDGGLAQVDLDDFSADILTARSDYNRWLPTLQCYSTFPTRQFYGTLSVSNSHPTKGWVSTGVHDNGNIASDLGAAAPWQQVEGGDGGWNAFVDDGGLIRNITDPATSENFARSAQRQGTRLVDNGIPPLPGLPPGGKNGLNSPIGDVVRRPQFRNRAGQLMYVAAGAGSNIYGLFPDGNAQMTYHWELLGRLPQGLVISSAAGGIGSHTGGTVFVGTTTGRIFALDSKQGSFLELPVILPKPMPNQPQSGGNLNRIVTLSRTLAFAILNGTNLKNNYVLRLDILKWSPPISAGLPTDQFFYALEGVSQEDRQLIFVATDECVYMSEDRGDNWVRASGGLPRRPHCADLRVAVDREQSWLYLSTFGRSVWRARLSRSHHG